MKSGHAIELSELFNHAEETLVTGRQFDATFSKTMRKMWVQFAKTGDPSLSADISPDGKAKTWPSYDPENRQVSVYDYSKDPDGTVNSIHTFEETVPVGISGGSCAVDFSGIQTALEKVGM